MEWTLQWYSIIGDRLLWADLRLNPPDLGPLRVANEVTRSLSHLVGEYGGRPVLLAATASGELKVADAAVLAKLTSMHVQLVNIETQLGITLQGGETMSKWLYQLSGDFRQVYDYAAANKHIHTQETADGP